MADRPIIELRATVAQSIAREMERSFARVESALNTPIEDIRAMADKIKDLPPVPSVITARHDVPYGRAFRMYDTRGRMIVYANRGEIHDLPRVKPKRSLISDHLAPLFGVPVRFE